MVAKCNQIFFKSMNDIKKLFYFVLYFLSLSILLC